MATVEQAGQVTLVVRSVIRIPSDYLDASETVVPRTYYTFLMYSETDEHTVGYGRLAGVLVSEDPDYMRLGDVFNMTVRLPRLDQGGP